MSGRLVFSLWQRRRVFLFSSSLTLVWLFFSNVQPSVGGFISSTHRLLSSRTGFFFYLPDVGFDGPTGALLPSFFTEFFYRVSPVGPPRPRHPVAAPGGTESAASYWRPAPPDDVILAWRPMAGQTRVLSPFLAGRRAATKKAIGQNPVRPKTKLGNRRGRGPLAAAAAAALLGTAGRRPVAASRRSVAPAEGSASIGPFFRLRPFAVFVVDVGVVVFFFVFLRLSLVFFFVFRVFVLCASPSYGVRAGATSASFGAVRPSAMVEKRAPALNGADSVAENVRTKNKVRLPFAWPLALPHWSLVDQSESRALWSPRKPIRCVGVCHRLDFGHFYRVLPGFTGFYRVLLGFTGFDLVEWNMAASEPVSISRCTPFLFRAQWLRDGAESHRVFLPSFFTELFCRFHGRRRCQSTHVAPHL